MKKYLYDSIFLKQLDEEQHKELYARIICLDRANRPLENIVGRITGGSINIDGASAIRRTCSLSLVAQEADQIITNQHWCYENNFKLEIGLKNTLNSNYPDIIWFDMGIYIIASFNVSRNLNSLNISINGKDKMCRLNGEISGKIAMSTDFGTEEIINQINGTGEYMVEKNQLPIYKIIYHALREYGQEAPNNIIINDLDEVGYELWEYRGDQPMYFIIEKNTGNVINMTLNGNTQINYQNTTVALKQLQNFQFYSMNVLDPEHNKQASTFIFNGLTCYLAKIEYGDTAGYHQIPLVYNSELILAAGDTITSLLDKLKNMLGNFEYFYDLQGRFVFQKKQNYIQELFSPIDGELMMANVQNTPYAYQFNNEKLFTAISQSPNINNIKNEFVVWGTRKSSNGNGLPIHARCANQAKPLMYTSPYVRYERIKDLYYLDIKEESQVTNEHAYNQFTTTLYYLDNGVYRISDKFIANTTYVTLTLTSSENASNNTLWHKQVDGSFIAFSIYTPKTAYVKISEQHNIIDTNEEYVPAYHYEEEFTPFNPPFYYRQEANTVYNSSEYDWRELIYQMAVDYLAHGMDTDYNRKLTEANTWCTNNRTGYEQYYSDIQGFWRQLYNPNPTYYDTEQYGEFYTKDDIKPYWNKKIHTDPSTLNFWFDLFDIGGELSKYSVEQLGTRSEVVNDTAISSIYLNKTPEVLFIVMPYEQDVVLNDARTNIWIQDNMETLFYRSAQGVSAIDKINEIFNQRSAITENLSITSIPIYYLQPNTRVYVKGKGDYNIDKISYSLNYNGTMNLTLNKILTPMN